jgi:hypothetical protein
MAKKRNCARRRIAVYYVCSYGYCDFSEHPEPDGDCSNWKDGRCNCKEAHAAERRAARRSHAKKA